MSRQGLCLQQEVICKGRRTADTIEKLIEAKAHGQKLAVVPHKVLAPAVDLMAALKKSIEQKPAAGKALLKSVPEPSRKRKAG